MAAIQRIEMRVEKDIKVLAERAAAAAGYSLTDYLSRLILADAPKALKTHTEIQLTNRQFDQFLAICENSPAPSPRILDAAKRLDREGF